MNMYNQIHYTELQAIVSNSDIVEFELSGNVVAITPNSDIKLRSVSLPSGLASDPLATVRFTIVNAGPRSLEIMNNDPLGTGIKFRTRSGSDYVIGNVSSVSAVIAEGVCYIETP